MEKTDTKYRVKKVLTCRINVYIIQSDRNLVIK